MTKLIEKALAAVRVLKPDEQDDIAGVMLSMSQSSEPEPFDPAHLDAVLRGLADIRAGRVARSEDVVAACKSVDA